MIVVVAESRQRAIDWCREEGIDPNGRQSRHPALPRVVILSTLDDVDRARGLTWAEGDRLVYRGFPADAEANRRIYEELRMMRAPIDGPTG